MEENQSVESVSAACGANSQMLPVVGQTVGQVRGQARDVLNIPENAQALVSGSRVADEYVIRAGDRLEFVKPSGANG